MNRLAIRVIACVVAAVFLGSSATAMSIAPASAKPTCNGRPATIIGTSRGEVIVGTARNDVIVGRGGHDIIHGRGGNDVICGNTGNDRIVGGAGNDLLLGKHGRDRLFGGAGRDLLNGGPSDDYLNGGFGSDACLQGTGTGLLVSCERPPTPIPAPPSTPAPSPTPEPTPSPRQVAYREACEANGGSYRDSYYPVTAATPVCLFIPSLGTPEPWNTVFHILGQVCASPYRGNPSADPQWMGCD